MLNFSIKLNHSQFIQMGKIIGEMLNMSYQNLSYENYVDFFNLKSLYKKIFDKLYKVTATNNNFMRVSISANELKSLRLALEINRYWLDGLPYETALFMEVNKQANRNEVNLIANREHLIE